MTIHINPLPQGEETNVLPNPDVAQLERFVDVLFKRAYCKGFVSLRAFPHKKGNSPPIFIEPITLDHPQFLDVTAIRAQQAATWHGDSCLLPARSNV